MIDAKIPLGGINVKTCSAPCAPGLRLAKTPRRFVRGCAFALNPLNRERRCVRVVPTLFQADGSVGSVNARGERFNRSPLLA
jgi:hypothetical protein